MTRTFVAGRDFGKDGRRLSIQRVNADPDRKVSAAWKRPGTNTLRGPSEPVLKCTILGRLDAYSATRSTAQERHTAAGEGAQERWRFEAPSPTDEAGTTLDCERGDMVVVSGVAYRCINLVVTDGMLEALLERWK